MRKWSFLQNHFHTGHFTLWFLSSTAQRKRICKKVIFCVFFFFLVESCLYHNFKSSTFSSALLSLDGQVNSGGCDCLGQTNRKYIQIAAFF